MASNSYTSSPITRPSIPDPLLLAFDALDLVAQGESALAEMVALMQAQIQLTCKTDQTACQLANVALSLASTHCDCLGSCHAELLHKLELVMAAETTLH